MQKALAAKDDLIHTYKGMLSGVAASPMQGKRKGNRGGGSWDENAVKLVCELLVLGVPPSVIPGTIVLMYESLLGKSLKQVPSASFARECWDVVRIVCETLTAMRLASSDDWKQLFTDATARRQQLFQTLIIGLGTNDKVVDPIIVSSCIFFKDESYETTFDSIKGKILGLKQRITQLKEVVKGLYIP